MRRRQAGGLSLKICMRSLRSGAARRPAFSSPPATPRWMPTRGAAAGQLGGSALARCYGATMAGDLNRATTSRSPGPASTFGRSRCSSSSWLLLLIVAGLLALPMIVG